MVSVSTKTFCADLEPGVSEMACSHDTSRAILLLQSVRLYCSNHASDPRCLIMSVASASIIHLAAKSHDYRWPLLNKAEEFRNKASVGPPFLSEASP